MKTRRRRAPTVSLATQVAVLASALEDASIALHDHVERTIDESVAPPPTTMATYREWRRTVCNAVWNYVFEGKFVAREKYEGRIPQNAILTHSVCPLCGSRANTTWSTGTVGPFTREGLARHLAGTHRAEPCPALEALFRATSALIKQRERTE